MSGQRHLTDAETLQAPETFPRRLSQTMSNDQYDQLKDLCATENRKLRRDGHEQVFTMTGLIRSAVFICLADPKLTTRLLKVAADPRLSGRGGIAHLVKTRVRNQERR